MVIQVRMRTYSSMYISGEYHQLISQPPIQAIISGHTKAEIYLCNNPCCFGCFFDFLIDLLEARRPVYIQTCFPYSQPYSCPYLSPFAHPFALI